MDDLEICKRIAEINLNKEIYALQVRGNRLFYCHNSPLIEWKEYNPITDDALCFGLLKKCNIDLIPPYLPNNDTQYEAQIFTGGIADVLSEYDDNPNKAIYLAIIEAHKDNS